MTLHLPTFFAYVRRAPFGGRLSQSQVDGLEAVLAAASDLRDDRHLAYILATALHETGGKMQPVREGFAKTDAAARRAVAGRRYAVVKNGHVYYGRGLVQLTWERNYIRMGQELGLDLKNNPDLMLDPAVSAKALIVGMRDGLFTNKRLDQYFSATVDDAVGARRIVNGTDKASLIAGYYGNFLDAIAAAKAEAARQSNGLTTRVQEHAPDGADLKKDPVVIGGVLTGAGAIGGMVTYAKPVLESINSPWAMVFAVVIALGLFLVLTGRVQIKRTGGV